MDGIDGGKMIGHVWKDGEGYPIYGIDENTEYDSVEIPDELYERYIEARKSYLKVQEELSKYYQEVDDGS